MLQWHLGMFAKEYTPTHRGFDSHYGYYQGAEGFFDHTYEANDVGTCSLFFHVSMICLWKVDYFKTACILLE